MSMVTRVCTVPVSLGDAATGLACCRCRPTLTASRAVGGGGLHCGDVHRRFSGPATHNIAVRQQICRNHGKHTNSLLSVVLAISYPVIANDDAEFHQN